jgi:WhiB family redox-sensing transcriptional regulator
MQPDGSARSPDGVNRLPRGFDDAACRPHPTSWWFADGPEDVEATLICMQCEARRACLEYALEHPELLGIWAATTPQERAEIRSTRHPSLGLRRPPEGRPER